MTEDEISGLVVGAAYRVHKALGPGLLESVYEACMKHELCKAGLRVDSQKVLPVRYDHIELECGYRADLVIDSKFIIEIKAVNQISEIHLAQLLTYLKLADYRLGLLINFNVPLIKNGIRRVINGF